MIIFILITKLTGSSLFLPDSDTAALIALVSNSAATVSNTLKILEVAKETSSQIDKYNFLVMRRYFLARRIEQHARDMAAVKKMRPRDLKELNKVLLRLKTNLRGLRSAMDFMGKDIFDVDDFTARYWQKISNAMEDEQEAHLQEISSSSSEANPSQNTAMNTAMNVKVLSKIRKDQLEYQKLHLQMKKSNTVSKLRKEQFYRDWFGVETEW